MASRAELEKRFQRLQREYQDLVRRFGEDKLKIDETGPYQVAMSDLAKGKSGRSLERSLKMAEKGLAKARRRLGL